MLRTGHDVADPDGGRPGIGRFLPPIPPWITASFQRLLGLVATVSLLLPLVTVQPCNGSPQRLTGVAFYTTQEPPIPLIVLLVVLAIVLIRPWRPARGEGAAGIELGHAALLGAWVGVAAMVAAFFPLFSVFSSHFPEIGYLPHVGGWVGLFGMLTLIGLIRLPTLLRAPPPVGAVLLGASVLFVPPLAVIIAGEAEPGTLTASAVPTVVVGIPLAVAIAVAGLRARRGPIAAYVLLTAASTVVWLSVWTLVALRIG